MSDVTPFEYGASLARVTGNGGGFLIDTRGPRAAHQHRFACSCCAAEMAVVLRDEGGWALRFGNGAEEVRALVAELDRDGIDERR